MTGAELRLGNSCDFFLKDADRQISRIRLAQSTLKFSEVKEVSLCPLCFYIVNSK
jgi:hypothetical protein